MDNILHDIPTEESVIAHIIAAPATLDEIRSRLDEDSFHSEPCKMLWKAIVWATNNGNTPDLPFLQAIFRDRGRTADLDNLNRIAESPVSSNISQQVDILEERRKRRIYHNLRIDLMKNEGQSSTELDRIIEEATERRDKFTASAILDKTSLMQYACDLINSNLDPNRVNRNISTPFRILPELPPESEVIVAAFSSQGKTAFAMTIVDYAMQTGVNCAIYSAEMGKSSIAGRLLNMMGWNVPITLFKTASLFDQTVADFNNLAGQFIDRPGNIFLDDSSNNNVDYICSSIRLLVRKHNVQLVMVDYLQIIALYDETAASDQERLARASRKLQAVAKQLNICILVLSQFSRPVAGQGHQPSEDLIRGSGQIYEACDIAIYVYRPEKWESETYPDPFRDAEKKSTAMIKIGKYRDGESGLSEICGFDGPATKFYEFPEGQYDQDPRKNYPKSATPPQQEQPDNDRPF